MKQFLIFVALLIAVGIWFQDWMTSGKMDNFILEHSDSAAAPNVIFALATFYGAAGESRTAAHYYRWLIEKYPGHSKVIEARYNLGVASEEFGDRHSAMEQYIVLKDSFTHTRYGKLAKQKYDRTRF